MLLIKILRVSVVCHSHRFSLLLSPSQLLDLSHQILNTQGWQSKTIHRPACRRLHCVTVFRNKPEISLQLVSYSELKKPARKLLSSLALTLLGWLPSLFIVCPSLWLNTDIPQFPTHLRKQVFMHVLAWKNYFMS